MDTTITTILIQIQEQSHCLFVPRPINQVCEYQVLPSFLSFYMSLHPEYSGGARIRLVAGSLKEQMNNNNLHDEKDASDKNTKWGSKSFAPGDVY